MSVKFDNMGLSKGEKKKLSQTDLERIRKIAEKLRKLRIEKGYTSYENLAFDTQIPRMIVYRMEKGDRDFNFTTLLKILDALEIDISDFFKGIK